MAPWTLPRQMAAGREQVPETAEQCNPLSGEEDDCRMRTPRKGAKDTYITTRDTNIHTNRQTYKQPDRHTDRHANKQTYKHTDKQINKQTNRQTDKQTNRQTDKLTNKQIA